MANRPFVPPKGYLEKQVATLFLTVNLGATGAVSSITGKGTTSVVRNSAGLYTVTLADKYSRFLGVDPVLRGTASSGVPGAGKADTIFPLNYVVGAPGTASTFQLQCVHALATPVAADATDNWFIDLTIQFADTTLP
jgi:hypothetical protein